MQQWYSAQELVGVAGLSINERVIRRMADKEAWRFQSLSRSPIGCGGGKEYHFGSLPRAVQAALAMRWYTTHTKEGKQAMKRAKDGASSSSIQRWDAFGRLPGSQQKQGHKRMAVLMALLALESNGLTRNQAIAALQKQGAAPDRKTVFRWLERVRSYPITDWLPMLAPSHGGGQQTANGTLEAWSIYKSDYLRPERPSATACYRRLQQAAAQNDWQLPSLKTLTRRLKREVSRPTIMLARRGEGALENTYPAQERTAKDLFALALVCGDGHRFDVFTKWPGQKKPVRPMLLALQDVYEGQNCGLADWLKREHLVGAFSFCRPA